MWHLAVVAAVVGGILLVLAWRADLMVDFDNIIRMGFFLVVVGVIGFSVVDIIQQARVERACLQQGFPQGDFRWIGPNYCIKRVDQTDSVQVLQE